MSINHSNDLDFENCAREPIHIINSIQAHGLLLVFNLEDKKCIQWSNNWEEYLAVKLFDLRLIDILDKHQIQRIEDAEEDVEKLIITSFSEQCFKTEMQMQAHSKENLVILECMPLEERVTLLDNVVSSSVNEAINNWSDESDIDQLSKKVVHFIRSLTGFDRVLMYRFDPNDYSGETIAESSAGASRFYGLRFPASDIPEQARRLYLKNPIRIIADVEANPVDIKPRITSVTQAYLDMSQCMLRSVSPIHVQYLKNMKVGASMSLSVIVNGKLWGLVSCHHNTARNISFGMAKTLSNLAKVVSLIIASINTRNETTIKVKHNELLEWLENRSDLAELFNGDQGLLDLNIADGWLLESGGKVYVSGTQLSEYNQALILGYLKSRPAEVVFTNAISSVVDDLRDQKVGGFMGFHSTVGSPYTLVALRKQTIQQVKWGGKKTLEVQQLHGMEVLTPRKSFEIYEETIRNNSEGWQAEDKFLFEQVIEMVNNLLISSSMSIRQENYSLRQISTRQEKIIKKQSTDLESMNSFLLKKNQQLEQIVNTLTKNLHLPLNQLNIDTATFKDLIEANVELDKSRTQDYIEEIQGSADRMTDLLRDLFNDLRELKRDSGAQLINSYAIVHDVVNDLSGLLINHSAVVKIEEVPDLNMRSQDFYQLMMNLISNAITHAQDNYKPMVVVGGVESDNGVEIYVKDNGIALDEAYKKELYHIIEEETVPSSDPIRTSIQACKEILNVYGGKIWLEQNTNVLGLSFFVEIPD